MHICMLLDIWTVTAIDNKRCGHLMHRNTRKSGKIFGDIHHVDPNQIIGCTCPPSPGGFGAYASKSFNVG